jgi:hypothetical protein
VIERNLSKFKVETTPNLEIKAFKADTFFFYLRSSSRSPSFREEHDGRCIGGGPPKAYYIRGGAWGMHIALRALPSEQIRCQEEGHPGTDGANPIVLASRSICFAWTVEGAHTHT